MIQGYQIRRAVIILLLTVVVIFAVAWLGRMARNAFDGDSQAAPDGDNLVLTDYNQNGDAVRLTGDTPVAAAENHRVIRITVSPSRRNLDIMQGFDGRVIRRVRLANTQAAYETFLRAVNFAGFSEERRNALGDDERGVCAEGERIVAEVIRDGQSVSRLWAASCNNNLGTLRGNGSNLARLFAAQIPNFDELTRDVNSFYYF